MTTKPWTTFDDERLLDVRISALGVKIPGTTLVPRITQLYDELKAKGLSFRPHCWLSNEWFSPADVPGIAIPFYLAHPRLIRLEERMMFEVEGGSKEWCMRLLRHEAGHAFETAYQLHRRKEWKALFGNANKPYPEHYRPKTFSRRYVLHLDWWYAQSHPSEDFAETFAEWLRPKSQWQRRYADWPALKKLQYVDRLMTTIGKKPPNVRSRQHVDAVSSISDTLRTHYAYRRERYGGEYPDVYDRDLRRLFGEPTNPPGKHTGAAFLRKTAADIRRTVAAWTGEHPYMINQLIREMIKRSRELDLRLTKPMARAQLDAAVLVTMLTMNYLHSPDHRLAI